MSPSVRNTLIYLLAAACALILASRIVTVALLLIYAPEDAEPNFYLQQLLISVLCIGAIIWLWSKRSRQQETRNED